MADLLQKVAARRFPVAAGFAAFLDDASRGDRDAVRGKLAENPAIARGSDDTGDTALHRAAEIGDLEMMDDLIGASSKSSSANTKGMMLFRSGPGSSTESAGLCGFTASLTGSPTRYRPRIDCTSRPRMWRAVNTN